MKRYLPFAPWLLAGIIVLGAAFFAGRALHPDKSAAYSYEASTPAYEAPKSVAGADKAGLSGFGEDELGRTVVSGHVVAFSGDTLTLQSAAGVVNTVRLSPQAPLRELVASDQASLRAGVNVVVRLSGKDEASAVLVLPPQ